MIQTKCILNLRARVPVSTTCRYISWDKLDNKTITRLESDIELGDCEFKGRLINRNPRNSEQWSLEHKPTGFWLDKSPPRHWNKIVLEQTDDHLDAYLKHWSGKKIVYASTREPQLQKYFRSPSTKHAAVILGKVISRRCQQSGYIYAGIDGTMEQAPKMKAFDESVQLEGLTLGEPPEIYPRSNTDL